MVFFALTCFSAEDVPRGLDFLFDRHRLNVAVSRAQCLAVLVYSPRLRDAPCRTLDQLELLTGSVVSWRRPGWCGRGEWVWSPARAEHHPTEIPPLNGHGPPLRSAQRPSETGECPLGLE